MENTTCPQCGNPVEQSGRGRPRRFCKPQCGIDFANDAKPRKHGDQAGFDATRHMLTEIDLDARTATCSKCGPVRVWSAGSGGRVQCVNRARAQQAKPASRLSNRESAWRRRGIKLTGAQFDAMYEAQGGACAVCFTPVERQARTTHVDHCHATGVVRGITCDVCNRLMGLAGDDPARLRAAADHLENNATAAVRP